MPGVAGPNLAPRITFSYAPANMQALPDGAHVGRDASHAGHGHSHGHGAHGHGHGAHGHGAHGHGHGPPHTPSPHQMAAGPPPTMASHQGTPHGHQPPPPPPSAPSHSHSHGQDHPSASATGEPLSVQAYARRPCVHAGEGETLQAFCWLVLGAAGRRSISQRAPVVQQ